MLNKQIHYSNQQLQSWVDGLIYKGKTVIGPVKKNGVTCFSEIKNFNELILNERTVYSAKEVVLPKYDILFKFAKEKDKVFISKNENSLNNVIVIGLRPCDNEGFDYLRLFFKSDPDILQKLNTFISVTIACEKKFDGCFCEELGIDKNYSDKTDVLIKTSENGYDIYFNDRGNEILSPQASDVKPAEIKKPVPNVSIDNKVAYLKKLSEQYNSEKWKIVSMGCLGCGSCAFVCPTCTCFDVQDEGNTQNGQRLICWDACEMGLFTKHASGHNPRPSQVERRRHRIMHKFVYTQDTEGKISCVGCGRCIAACPAHLNIYNQALQILQ